jgi:5-methylcytosine-specific restriction endonuclease McrA
MSKQSYMRKADASFSRYIRIRDGRCLSCGAADNLQCAHLISRSYKSIRTDENNAVALCRSCHVKYTHRPLEWREWVAIRFPGRWDELSHKALRYGRVDWRSQMTYWAERVRQLEGAEL